MNWEAIAAICEIVGAIAVVISLIYLAAQIHQNTQQIKNSIEVTQLAAFERNIESGNRMREFFLLNPGLFEIYSRGRSSYLKLESSERQKFAMMVRNIFSEVQGVYIRQCSLSHDPEGFVGLSKVVDEIISGQGIQEYLGSSDPDWRPEFQEFVASRLAIATSKTERD